MDGHAIKLIGNSQYISFYDEGNSPKGYIWNDGNNMVISTYASNFSGELQLNTGNAGGIAIQSDGRMRAGALACTIPLQTLNGPILPKLSIQGTLGFKKMFDDQVGEWTMSHFYNALFFSYNGGSKAYIDDIDGDWVTLSDSKLKKELKAYIPVLDGIKKLDVLTYHYKADKSGERSFGLIAQNVQQYFPEVVGLSDHDNLLGIKYSKIGVLAIKAIQEQQVIIENQEKKIDELEKRLARLESKIQ